ncbi:hypothetical protein [Asticcacaulis sp. AC460]|uniref:hypothetical protein n=1 Tax=Asticcacaulis sp. AC460 TaxID=1282360 RepID=UPI0012DD12EC|nr:hypothetical protein [Asticcacaulis sp. AC460]
MSHISEIQDVLALKTGRLVVMITKPTAEIKVGDPILLERPDGRLHQTRVLGFETLLSVKGQLTSLFINFEDSVTKAMMPVGTRLSRLDDSEHRVDACHNARRD